MTQLIAEHISFFASQAHLWGFFFIFFFMAVESSFIPFPSEVVMIPAGFLAYQGQLTTGCVWTDVILAVLIGTAGSLAGAYVNYFLAEKLGRAFLYRYGKYFFLKEETLNRAEEIFREYGDITTFVCRLLPAIRQLISIPAGLAKMKHSKFIFFTVLGAGIWNIILTAVGMLLGKAVGKIDGSSASYMKLINDGKKMISDHYLWIILALAVLIVCYIFIHKKIMGSDGKKA